MIANSHEKQTYVTIFYHNLFKVMHQFLAVCFFLGADIRVAHKLYHVKVEVYL